MTTLFDEEDRAADHPRRRAAAPHRRGARDRGPAFYEHDGVDYEGTTRALVPEPRRRRDRAGRLDDHATARQEHDGRPGEARPEDEDPRGGARRPARERDVEGRDPRALPQRHLLRERRVRRQGGVRALLREARSEAAHDRRVGAPRRADPVARGPQPVTHPDRAARRRATVLDAMVDTRQDHRGRSARRAGGAAADDGDEPRPAPRLLHRRDREAVAQRRPRRRRRRRRVPRRRRVGPLQPGVPRRADDQHHVRPGPAVDGGGRGERRRCRRRRSSPRSS